MREPEFQGIYPMLYTFFDEAGAPDREGTRQQVEACIAAGSHGLAVGGLASECNKLSTGEKRMIAEWVLTDVNGRVPVSVTISEATIGEQLDAVKAAADHGAAWAVLQPPPVRTASEDALIRFFGAVADTAPIPIGIQNAPQFIGIGLSNAGLIELNRRHPNVSILKAESTAIESGDLADNARGAFDLFNGRNGIDLIDMLRLGFHGIIPSPDAVDVEARVFDLFKAGETDEAERLFKDILPLLTFLMISVDHLLCYGKRLTARRIGIGDVHDRIPAQEPRSYGMDLMQHWSRGLGPLGE